MAFVRAFSLAFLVTTLLLLPPLTGCDETGASSSEPPVSAHRDTPLPDGFSHHDHSSKDQSVFLVLGICLWIILGLSLALDIWWICKRPIPSGEGHGDVEVELATVIVPPPSHGLQPAETNMLPVVTYPPPPQRAGDHEPNSTCPICLMDFSTEAEIRGLPCHHYFHPTCVDPYLLDHSSCPSCRQTVTVGDI